MTQAPRIFTLKDTASATVAYGSACRQHSQSGCPITAGFGSRGEVFPDGGFEETGVAAEWLAHVQAGRIG
jgi:hypothetical protein